MQRNAGHLSACTLPCELFPSRCVDTSNRSEDILDMAIDRDCTPKEYSPYKNKQLSNSVRAWIKLPCAASDQIECPISYSNNRTLRDGVLYSGCKGRNPFRYVLPICFVHIKLVFLFSYLVSEKGHFWLAFWLTHFWRFNSFTWFFPRFPSRETRYLGLSLLPLRLAVIHKVTSLILSCRVSARASLECHPAEDSPPV